MLLISTPAFGKTVKKQHPYEKAVATARSDIWRAINSGKCGSATAAVTVDGKVVYAEGFGMADREKSIPVTKDTLFNIGSISKVYVAAAIMLLVEDGRVSLDKPAADYIPEFRMADDRYKKITVRMLLNHTSGIPGTEMLNSFGYEYNLNLKRETIDTLSRSHLKHEPGTMAVYCNDGFTLAEMIVERVSGNKYIDFLNKRVFRKLGLKNTGLSVGEIRGKPVAFYYDAGTGKAHPSEVISVLGAGGLSATAIDVCRFADSFAGNRLFRKGALVEMKKAQPPVSRLKFRNSPFSHGLGWDFTSMPRHDAAGIQVLGKSGGTGNYSSMVYTVPAKRISVAVIASGSESGAMKIALDMLDAVLTEKKLIAGEEKSILVRPEAQKLPPDSTGFSGWYASESKIGQIVFDFDKKTATVYGLKGREKAPVTSLVYNNNYYHDPAGNRYYFAGSGDEGYFICNPAAFNIDTVMLQKIRTVEKPKSLRVNMDGRIWLRRNVHPFESVIALETHMVKSLLYKDLPGYVVFNGVKRIESPEFAGMPFDAVRDQTELYLFEKNGATWARNSEFLYSQAESAARLKSGENSVRIGNEGYSEWLAADEDVILSFTKPQRGRIIVFSSEDKVVYDSLLDRGDVYAEKGSYIESCGFADDVFRIKARPAR